MMRKSCFLFFIVLLHVFHSSLCVHGKELESLGFTRCKQHEQEALLRFKQSFTHDPMNRLSSWVGQDCCQWHGVTCDNVTHNVVKLNLRSLQRHHYDYDVMDDVTDCLPDPQVSMVSSGVSSALLELKLLTQLDLSGNNFSGSHIPEFIGSMRQLRYLNLSSAGFSGPIPPQLGNLPNLVHLDLHVVYECYEQNLLYGEGLGWASGLLRLQSLDMSGYNLSRAHDTFKVLNTLPSLSALSLSYCVLHNSHLSEAALTGNTAHSFFPTLQHLSLGGNSFNGSLPSSLGQLTNLNYLDLSQNEFNGQVPASFVKLSALKYLDLSNNKLSGLIPDFIGHLTQIEHLDISSNSLQGTVFDIGNLSKLSYLDMSYNNLYLKFDSSFNWRPRFQLQLFKVHSCVTNTAFPQWLKNQTQIAFLDLSDTGISGELTGWLWNLSSLQSIQLSGNQLTGSLPKQLSDSKMVWLDLHNNSLTGTIPKWLRNLENFQVIDLSSNRLTGEISDGNNASSLLNVGVSLEVLDLSDNMLSGEIQFGKVPSDTDLEILSLRGNHFYGPIHSELCNFGSLMVLDLAENRLTGHIPRCLGSMLFYNPDASLRSIIDLSSNLLVGTIPEELTNISALLALNLSYNQLTGHIPGNIGNLKALESLDLSNNRISGTIPQSLSSISWLSELNLSNNHLHGPIPTGSQLQTLVDPSIYANNSGLCGFPLPNDCPKPESPTSSTNINPTAGKDDVNKEDKYEKSWFIGGVMSGAATGFWGVVGTLVINRSWKEAYFRYVEEVANRIYGPIKTRVNMFKRRFSENS